MRYPLGISKAAVLINSFIVLIKAEDKSSVHSSVSFGRSFPEIVVKSGAMVCAAFGLKRR